MKKWKNEEGIKYTKKSFMKRRLIIIFIILSIILCLFISFVPWEFTEEEKIRKKSDISSFPSRIINVTCSSNLNHNKNSNLINGVILFLAGKNEPFFISKTLPMLEKNFLTYNSYPVHIFHENMSKNMQEVIRNLIPSAQKVIFEDVGIFWKNLPNNISEEELKIWMKTPEQKKYQGRGYRIMCRFWAGIVWQLSSLNSYEYYWRLDTDSYLTSPITCDIFQLMKINQCVYGYRRIRGENPRIIKDLWPTFLKWAKNSLSNLEINFITNFSLNSITNEYQGIMYYNNFELGTLALKRHPLYLSMFNFLDKNEPYGILRYRWGDAPIHTLGVEVVMFHEGWKKCQFDPSFAGYMHGKTV